MMILGFFILVFISAFVFPFNPLDILVCSSQSSIEKRLLCEQQAILFFPVRTTPRAQSSSSSSSYYSLRFLLTQKVCIMDSQIHTLELVPNYGPSHNAFHIRSTHWIERCAIKEKVFDDFVKISAFQPLLPLVLINLWGLCLHRLPIYGEMQIHFQHRTFSDPSWKIPSQTVLVGRSKEFEYKSHSREFSVKLNVESVNVQIFLWIETWNYRNLLMELHGIFKATHFPLFRLKSFQSSKFWKGSTLSFREYAKVTTFSAASGNEASQQRNTCRIECFLLEFIIGHDLPGIKIVFQCSIVPQAFYDSNVSCFNRIQLDFLGKSHEFQVIWNEIGWSFKLVDFQRTSTTHFLRWQMKVMKNSGAKSSFFVKQWKFQWNRLKSETHS